MPRTVILSLAVLAVLGLLLAACSQPEPNVTPEQQVAADQRPDDDGGGDGGGNGGDGAGGDGGGQPAGTFVAVDIDWKGAPDTLPSGETTLKLDNQGSLAHDLTLDTNGGQPVVEDIDGGESQTGTVQLSPGEHTFFCAVPGHRAAGMETTVTVK